MLQSAQDPQRRIWRPGWSSAEPSPRRNSLLACLPAPSYEALSPQLELVNLARGAVIHASRDLGQSIYFPTAGIVSVLQLMRDGRSIEVAIIGREGLVGASALLGCQDTASHVVVQAAGSAYRLSGSALRRTFGACDRTRAILLRYTHSLFLQTAQTAVCSRHHSVTQQLIRRLLLAIDRTLCASLALTHESMAAKLGVRRESVTIAAQKLQALGLISYRRGRVTVLDRAKLELLCCECYEAPRSDLELS
jgi:CRP-like cAMP-binding protein